MKILYLSHKIPYPLSDGGKLRVFNHISHLSKEHDVKSLSFIEDLSELEDIAELKKLCDVETVFHPKWKSLINSFLGLFSGKPLRVWYLKDSKFRKKAKALTRWADVVIIQAVRMEQYCYDPKKTMIDVVDTPSLQIKRALKRESFLWRLIWSIELPRIIKLEKRICKNYDNIITASEADRKAMGKGVVLKNGTKISDSHIDQDGKKGNDIMFLGNMEYPPNIDAVRYFVKNVFPLVKRRIKDARFYIVGKNPGKISELESKDVVVTGFVDDIGEYFSRCKVFAAPLFLGSGIQNKVLEALNYEIPIVTTSIVNQGVEAKDGKEIIIADDAKEFADKIIDLLENENLRERLSSEGKKFLKKNYSWKKIFVELSDMIEKL